MNGYDLLLREVGAIAEEMRKLQTLAVARYTPVVDAIIATRCHDTSHIEHTLDLLLDIAGHPAGLELFKRLCRYYYHIAPAATADYIHRTTPPTHPVSSAHHGGLLFTMGAADEVR